MSSTPQQPSARIGLDGRYLDAHHPGIGRYVFELARRLPQALGALPGAPSLSVLVREGNNGRFDLELLRRAGATLIPSRERPRGMRAPLRLGRLVRGLDVDLWHAPFFATSLGAPAPKVVTIYDTIGLLDPSYLESRWRRFVYRLLLRAALARTTAVITLSEAAARDVTDRLGVPRRRISVTPAGVDQAFRPASADAVSSLRQRLSLPERFTLYLGTDRPHKNLDRLCHAWRLVRAADPGTERHLVLAGFPRQTATTADRGDTRSGIRTLGRVEERDLPTLLSAAELFVLPSLTEGFGLPAIEAMACATPVACADAGSLAEVTGPAAARFDPQDSDAIASVIGGLLRNPDRRRQLVAAGLERAATFTWQRTAEATVATYRRCLDAKPLV